MADSKIEWTDKTWNPVTGCTKISPGCAHCYAEAIEKRFKRNPSFLPGEAVVRCHPDRLEQPLKWRKPQRIFVNSMSDLFHEDVSDEFIDQVFAVMAMVPRHTFQILTKRPERMLKWASDEQRESLIDEEMDRLGYDPVIYDYGNVGTYPLPNVHLYVSVENQYWADIRIPLLRQTPAAVRGVSYEPALKAVDFSKWLPLIGSRCYDGGYCHHECVSKCWRKVNCGPLSDPEPYLDHIIMGGESGPKARLMNPDWVRSTIEQCKAAGVAVFVKQMGSVWAKEHGSNSKGGDMEAWPEDLQIREYLSAKR